MANKKTAKKVTQQQQIMAMAKKPETILGAIVLTGIIIFGVNALRNNTSQTDAAKVLSDLEIEQDVTTPIVPEEQASAPASPSAKPLAAIEKLANTSSEKTVVAQDGDTFWDIAQTYCGQGKLGYSIQQENGYQYRHLQPGDVITVTCD